MKRVFLLAAFALLVPTLFFSEEIGALVVERCDVCAAVFLQDSSTPETLAARFAEAQNGGRPLQVLIVPGHDDAVWGTEYRGLKEADVNLALGTQLLATFNDNPLFVARLARNEQGYDPELSRYFTENRGSIIEFRSIQKSMMDTLVQFGIITPRVLVSHNTAPSEVALKLYGINKWANEKKFDLIIHIHFNDVRRTDRSSPGPYTGYAIYVPERQYSNAKGSLAIASAIEQSLGQIYEKSTLPAEGGGVVEDQELIAVGSNNTVDAAVALIEYAYIYEPFLQSERERSDTVHTMARLTYEGVRNYFSE